MISQFKRWRSDAPLLLDHAVPEEQQYAQFLLLLLFFKQQTASAASFIKDTCHLLASLHTSQTQS